MARIFSTAQERKASPQELAVSTILLLFPIAVSVTVQCHAVMTSLPSLFYRCLSKRLRITGNAAAEDEFQ